jgi:hypothetical protein
MASKPVTFNTLLLATTRVYQDLRLAKPQLTCFATIILGGGLISLSPAMMPARAARSASKEVETQLTFSQTASLAFEAGNLLS